MHTCSPKLLHFYIFFSILTKQGQTSFTLKFRLFYCIECAFFLVCTIFSLKIRSCKFLTNFMSLWAVPKHTFSTNDFHVEYKWIATALNAQFASFLAVTVYIDDHSIFGYLLFCLFITCKNGGLIENTNPISKLKWV